MKRGKKTYLAINPAENSLNDVGDKASSEEDSLSLSRRWSYKILLSTNEESVISMVRHSKTAG